MAKQNEIRLEKDGAVQVVTSAAEKVRLEWDGWTVTEPEAPVKPTVRKPE